MGTVEFEGKVVVVTGANGLLGSSVVSEFSDRGAVVVRVVQETSGRLEKTYACDVTDEKSVEQCFQDIATAHGSIYGLVHTVGTWGMSSLIDTTLEDWRSMVAVNLDSAFLCFREATRHMEGAGRLVAIASRQGADGGTARQAAYSASKGGLVRLVESVAEEYSDTLVTANAIAPVQISSEPDQPGVSPVELAGACAYLCSDAARSINGAVIRIYG